MTSAALSPEELTREVGYARTDAARAREVADEAKHAAESARNATMATEIQLGAVLRELSLMKAFVTRNASDAAGKIDACITDVRAALQEVQKMRPKAESFSEMEPALHEITASHNLHEHNARQRKKLARRLIIAALLGFAGVVGAGGGALALKACGAPAPQHLEIESP